ncbi:hypothetical protein ACFX15_042917 [Malus domestica]
MCLSFIRGLGLSFSAGSAFAINFSHVLAVAASSIEASADPSPTETDPEEQKIVDIPITTTATATRASDFAAHSLHFVLLEVSKTVEKDTSHLDPSKLHHGLPQHTANIAAAVSKPATTLQLSSSTHH